MAFRRGGGRPEVFRATRRVETDVFLFSIKEKKAYFKRFLFYLLTQLSLSFSNIYTVTSINDKKFDGSKFVSKYKNLIVFRSFNNFYSVESLTISYLITNSEHRISHIINLSKHCPFTDMIPNITK